MDVYDPAPLYLGKEERMRERGKDQDFTVHLGASPVTLPSYFYPHTNFCVATRCLLCGKHTSKIFRMLPKTTVFSPHCWNNDAKVGVGVYRPLSGHSPKCKLLSFGL